MEAERPKKGSGSSYLLLGLGVGILVTVAVVLALGCLGDRRGRDPRGEKVRDLIAEAERLISLGRRGGYVPRRIRG
jgi:L-aminopeptidase/D-esterase-like protein